MPKLPSRAGVKPKRILDNSTSALRAKRLGIGKADDDKGDTRFATFKDFFCYALPKYEYPIHLGEMLKIAERIADDKIEEGIKALCAIPPQHGKSTLLQALVLYKALKYPGYRIIYATYAERFTDECQALTYKIAHSIGVEFNKCNTSTWDLANGSAIRWASKSSGTTGIPADLVIADDLIRDAEEASSQTQRDKAWEFVTTSMLSRTRGKTSLMIVSTRWDPDDVQGRLIALTETIADVRWECVNVPAISIDGNGDEKALWEKEQPLKHLKELRATMGLDTFSCVYQGSPRNSKTRLFQEFSYYDELPTGISYKIDLGLDLAYDQKTKNDYTVGIAFYTVTDPNTGDRKYYVVDMVRDRFRRIEDAQNALIAFQRKYEGTYKMYTGGQESTILKLLTPFGIRAKNKAATVDKYQRAIPLASAVNNGLMVFPRNKEFTKVLVAEMQSFTGNDGNHDDMVDALASGFMDYGAKRRSNIWAQTNYLGIW